MKTLLGDDVDRTPIGPRSRVLQAVRASNGASRRVPVLLQASPVAEVATSAPAEAIVEAAVYRRSGKFEALL